MKELEMVAEFHKAFGHPIQLKPQIPFFSRRTLRRSLLTEECIETSNALNEGDLVESADGLCDLLYVLLGTVLELGLGDRFEELFAEVHRSNMSKLGEDGKPIFRADGKTLKGPNYSPPDLERILSKP